MRYFFSEDSRTDDPLFDLLDTVFPGLRQGADEIAELGVPWGSVSTPFLHLEGGRAVSHVGVIELPLVVMGERVKVGSIHAVATDPDFRRRGYYRRVIEEALEYCEGRYEAQILTTEHPEYFEPFGFRHVQEHRFTTAPFHPSEGSTDFVVGNAERSRPFDPRDPEDMALLHRLLETREPVSNVVGVVGEKAVFFFNQLRSSMVYVPDLDVLVCLELNGPRLTLHDVVGPAIPSLSALLERIGQAVELADPIEGFSTDPTEAAARMRPKRLRDQRRFAAAIEKTCSRLRRKPAQISNETVVLPKHHQQGTRTSRVRRSICSQGFGAIIEGIDICFSADRLAVEAEATPYLFDHDGPSYLMVRGSFAAEGLPFTLPRSART